MSTIEVLRKDERSARIRLARPERLNALSPRLLRDLIAACDQLATDPELRVVALEGAGETFSAGADLPEFAAELASAPEITADLGRQAAEAVAALPQITVALIRGHCVGGAVVLAASCDLRICADDTRFWIPEVEAGIPLAWGGMAHLVRLVGETLAADLVVTCRPFDAAEALQAGFVSRVVPTGEFAAKADALVATIAAKARHPLAVTKRQLQAIRSGSFDPATDAAALLEAFTDPEASEVVRSYTDRLR